MTREEMMKNYREWRKTTEELISDGMGGSVDCGESSVREDFTAWCDLEEEITFEEMLKLERAYEEVE